MSTSAFLQIRVTAIAIDAYQTAHGDKRAVSAPDGVDVTVAVMTAFAHARGLPAATFKASVVANLSRRLSITPGQADVMVGVLWRWRSHVLRAYDEAPVISVFNDERAAFRRRFCKIRPIKDRLAAAFRPGISLRGLASAVFPDSMFPKAWNHSVRGGPPAWTRPLLSALRRYGYTVKDGPDGRRAYATVYRRESAV